MSNGLETTRRWRLALLSCVLLAWGAATPVAGAQKASPARTAEPDAKAEEYHISPGDQLHVSVWREPDLTTDVFVRLDGRVTVPLLGDTDAAGRSPNQLAAEIQSKMARFLEVPPQVTVTVSQAVSARFFVLGEVAHSGAYPLQTRTTVLQALALAGGFGQFAKRERILILRENNGKRTALRLNYVEIEAGQGLEQDITLESGDTILVP